MKHTAPRLLACALSLILCMITLSGCTQFPLIQVHDAGDVTLPEPAQTIPEAPEGDSRTSRSERVTFYVIDEGAQQLTAFSRVLRLAENDTLIERVVERLLVGSSVVGLTAIAPEGTTLSGYELSQGILTVNLSVDALTADAQALCAMRASLCNTLTGLPGIRSVNVLIDGRAESALRLPTGALSTTDGNLTAMWAQLVADDQRFAEDPIAAQIDRSAILYFPTWRGDLLLPEARTIRLTDDNFAQRLLNELRKGPQTAHDAMHAVLPASASLMRAPDIATLPDGRRVLRISFREGLYEALEQEALSPHQLFASLALTLCRFVPEISGLMIGVGGELVTSVSSGLTQINWPDGVIRPEDFDEMIGCMGRLYFAREDGSLMAVDRVMSRATANSPRAMIELLSAGPLVYEVGALSVVPEGLTDADILGIRIDEDVALVNLSSNFYRVCQTLDPDAERALVYSIVNTLCNMDGVSRVRFYIAGEQADTLAQTICLRGELLPNPGLVRAEEAGG